MFIKIGSGNSEMSFFSDRKNLFYAANLVAYYSYDFLGIYKNIQHNRNTNLTTMPTLAIT